MSRILAIDMNADTISGRSAAETEIINLCRSIGIEPYFARTTRDPMFDYLRCKIPHAKLMAPQALKLQKMCWRHYFLPSDRGAATLDF